MNRDCGAWINMLSHIVKKRLNATLSDLGITGVQSRIMYYICEHCRSGPVFQKDVEEAFGLSRSTTTGVLQLLEKKGIIRRETVDSDARMKRLVPTQKAWENGAKIHACIMETDSVMTKGISPGQLQVFLEVAAKMYDNLCE